MSKSSQKRRRRRKKLNVEYLTNEINSINNKDLAQKLRQLNLMRLLLLGDEKREPLPGINKFNRSKKYGPYVEDYKKLIEEVNNYREMVPFTVELLILLASALDKYVYAYDPPLPKNLERLLEEI